VLLVWKTWQKRQAVSFKRKAGNGKPENGELKT
jgi:hypothetical protein